MRFSIGLGGPQTVPQELLTRLNSLLQRSVFEIVVGQDILVHDLTM